jgi:pilus assembly protein Flp/PilA
VRLLAKLASDFLRNESGATSIEYAMIATGISIVILAAVTGIGSAVKDDFAAASSALK